MEVRVFSTAPKKPASAGFFFFTNMFAAFVKVPRSRFPVWISLASASALATSGRGGAAFADLFFGRAGFGGAGCCLAESCFENASQNTACN
ncbi:hypothetical protein HRS00_08040 [Agrobacterium vaccinii]|nr:hypothetical protein HRS00_08040 [Agrobacterium vaccinii]